MIIGLDLFADLSGCLTTPVRQFYILKIPNLNGEKNWGSKSQKKSTKRAERILYWQMSWMRHSSPIPYWNFQFGRNMSTMCKDFHWKILECVQRNISRFGLKILEYLECKEIFQVIWKNMSKLCVLKNYFYKYMFRYPGWGTAHRSHNWWLSTTSATPWMIGSKPW